MAGLFNILKVTVSEDKICAHVLVNPGMPLMTSVMVWAMKTAPTTSPKSAMGTATATTLPLMTSSEEEALSSSEPAMLSSTPTVSVPSARPRMRALVCWASSLSLTICWKMGSMRRPSAVGSTPVLLRMSRGNPSSSSSALMRRMMPLGV